MVKKLGDHGVELSVVKDIDTAVPDSLRSAMTGELSNRSSFRPPLASLPPPPPHPRAHCVSRFKNFNSHSTAASIDALGSTLQLTLKVASVIGIVFDLQTLAQVHPGRLSLEDVRKEIIQIIEAGIVVPHSKKDNTAILKRESNRIHTQESFRRTSSMSGGWSERSARTNTYVRFKNENLRIVAYDMIPSSVREKFHRRVADALAGTCFCLSFVCLALHVYAYLSRHHNNSFHK